jgi:hypothetical protein
MAGITITYLPNGRLKCDTTGFNPNYNGICPYISTLRFRLRTDNKTIDAIYEDSTTLSICAHTDAPIVGVLPVEFIDDVEMTSQTQLYEALIIL